MTLRDTWTTGKSLVLRCALIPPASHLPATIIAKHPFALPDGPFADQVSFINEWAALVFLDQMTIDQPLAPHCYGGDRSTSVLVLEDLGTDDRTTAQTLVFGTDPHRAEAALLEHVALIGRLHATTIGTYRTYTAIRAALNPPVQPAELLTSPWPTARLSSPTTTELERLIHTYQAMCVHLGIRPPVAVGDEISMAVQQVEAHPGPWLAFCQGDQNAPGGTLRSAGRLRLYDFDCAQFRHALLEGAPGRTSWGCLMRIPVAIAHQMEAVYRATLAISHPHLQDERFFRVALAQAHARWHVFHVIDRLPNCLFHDRPRGPTTRRHQFLAWMDSFADIAEEANSMQALGTTARALAARLRQQWPSEVHLLPYYPAFQGETSS